MGCGRLIDEPAAHSSTKPCALAKAASLDSTVFNKFKRFGDTGLPRWPNAETIVRVLPATGTSFAAFGAYVDETTKGYVAPVEERPVLRRRMPKVA